MTQQNNLELDRVPKPTLKKLEALENGIITRGLAQIEEGTFFVKL